MAKTNKTARPTRYDELGYRQDAPGLWRVVDITDDANKAVGPQMRLTRERSGTRWARAVIYAYVSKYDEPVGIDFESGEFWPWQDIEPESGAE